MNEKDHKPEIAPSGISARNVLPARIRSIGGDGATSRVELELAGGELLVATLARSSVVELGLTPGSAALAIIKAPWLDLCTAGDAARLSSPNRLPGTITCVAPGTVNAEVRLKTAGGSELVAVLPRAAVAECGLAVGAAATAIVSPSDIVIGVRG